MYRRVLKMRVAAALLAGLAVFVLLHPTSGIDTLPPICSSAFGYIVPCEWWVSVAAGLATTAVTAVLLRGAGRRDQEA
jgi:hypothetical protein